MASKHGRSGLSEAGYGNNDQGGIHLAQPLIIENIGFFRPFRAVVDQDVCFPDQYIQNLPAPVGPQIQGNVLFVALIRQAARHRLAVRRERPQFTVNFSSRRFYPNDVGVMIRQHHTAVGGGDVAAHVQYLDAVKRSLHDSILSG